MELGTRMNKEKVEFIFEPKFSPLQRKILSNEIKAVTQVRNTANQLEQESKLDILNYLINSLSSTTKSIIDYHSSHLNQSIEQLLVNLGEHSNGNPNAMHESIDSNYKEIPAKTKKEALYLIKDNSEIRKDNYSIMFDSIKLTLDEVINPKQKTTKNKQQTTQTTRVGCLDPIVKLERKELKALSKTFNMTIDLNHSSANNISYNNNYHQQQHQHQQHHQSYLKNNQRDIQLNQPNKKYSVPYGFSKHGINISKEIKENELENIGKDIFRKKMITNKINKEKKEISKMKIMQKKNQKYLSTLNNNSLIANNSNKSEIVSNEFVYEPQQQQKQNHSAIINLKKNHVIPLPLGSLYHKPISRSKNSNNSHNYSNSTSNHNCCSVIEEEKKRNSSVYIQPKKEISHRTPKKNHSSIISSSSLDKKSQKAHSLTSH